MTNQKVPIDACWSNDLILPQWWWATMRGKNNMSMKRLQRRSKTDVQGCRSALSSSKTEQYVVSWACFDFEILCRSLWLIIIVAHPDAPEYKIFRNRKMVVIWAKMHRLKPRFQRSGALDGLYRSLKTRVHTMHFWSFYGRFSIRFFLAIKIHELIFSCIFKTWVSKFYF